MRELLEVLPGQSGRGIPPRMQAQKLFVPRAGAMTSGGKPMGLRFIEQEHRLSREVEGSVKCGGSGVVFTFDVVSFASLKV